MQAMFDDVEQYSEKVPTCAFSLHRERHHLSKLSPLLFIGVSGSFFRGGQQLHPAKIQSLPAEISPCQGGPYVLPSFPLPISVLPSYHFCPAKLPFLSCQAPIF